MNAIVHAVLSLLLKPEEAREGKICLPRSVLYIGLTEVAVFIVLTVISALTDKPVWLTILAFSLSIPGMILIIGFINCRVSYDDTGFESRSFFGVKRRYTYVHVTAIKKNMHETYVYMGKRRLMIDEIAVGGKAFLTLVKKRYRIAHNGQALPEIRNSKYDIFNGHVKDAGGFLFLYVFIGVVIIVFAVLLVWYIYLNTASAANTIEQKVTFRTLRIDDDEIILTGDDNRLYKIRFVKDDFDKTGITSVFESKTSVTVYSHFCEQKNGEDYYSVKAILDGDKYILSFDETNGFHRSEYWPLIIFPVIFAVVWGAFVYGSVKVGRDPQKYGKKVVKRFFQDGYVDY